VYPAFLSSFSLAQGAFPECVFKFFCYLLLCYKQDPDPVQNGRYPQHFPTVTIIGYQNYVPFLSAVLDETGPGDTSIKRSRLNNTSTSTSLGTVTGTDLEGSNIHSKPGTKFCATVRLENASLSGLVL